MGAIELLVRLAFRSFSTSHPFGITKARFTFRKSLFFRNSRLALSHLVSVLLPSWFQFHQFPEAPTYYRCFFTYTHLSWRNPIQVFPFGLGNMISSSHTIGITRFRACSCVSSARVNSSVLSRPTLRSTRTPPALPSVLSQLLASSSPLSPSVQAWPVSFRR